MTNPDIQQTFTYTQKIKGKPQHIFPLLCPKRETDWLDGWEYKMIYSESGFAEENCVFATPIHSDKDTYWAVSRYEPSSYRIDFVRFTLPDMIVKITIQVCEPNEDFTPVKIVYTYTALNDKQKEYLQTQMPHDFKESMLWWEKSMNHYLETNKMLKQ